MLATCRRRAYPQTLDTAAETMYAYCHQQCGVVHNQCLSRVFLAVRQKTYNYCASRVGSQLTVAHSLLWYNMRRALDGDGASLCVSCRPVQADSCPGSRGVHWPELEGAGAQCHHATGKCRHHHQPAVPHRYLCTASPLQIQMTSLTHA